MREEEEDKEGRQEKEAAEEEELCAVMSNAISFVSSRLV